MANNRKVSAIERELAERFGSLCLDNRPERMKLARWIAEREEAAARIAAPPMAADAAAEAPAGAAPYRVPVYDVRLVQSRRALTLAEPAIHDSVMSARVLHRLIGASDREHFACLFVNCRNVITGAHIAAVGGQAHIELDMRPMLRAAFAACAHALVLGHNHPSGDAVPSREDFAVTERIIRAGQTVAMQVLDHVIVTHDPGRWYSMRGAGPLSSVEP